MLFAYPTASKTVHEFCRQSYTPWATGSAWNLQQNPCNNSHLALNVFRTTLEKSDVQISLSERYGSKTYHRWPKRNILYYAAKLILILLNSWQRVHHVFAHTLETSTPLVKCTVNDALVCAVSTIQLVLLQFVNVMHPRLKRLAAKRYPKSCRNQIEVWTV